MQPIFQIKSKGTIILYCIIWMFLVKRSLLDHSDIPKWNCEIDYVIVKKWQWQSGSQKNNKYLYDMTDSIDCLCFAVQYNIARRLRKQFRDQIWAD